MNGWEIACMIVGLLLVIEDEKVSVRSIGALMVLLPLYFNIWRNCLNNYCSTIGINIAWHKWEKLNETKI